MRKILLPLCIPVPNGKLAYYKSRCRLEWDYQKYLPRAHENILAVRNRMPAEKFDRYFKFAFVRNPWERLVSEYEYILARPEHGRHRRVKDLNNFQAFIEMQIPRPDAYQMNMLCDKKGAMLMDFVGKVENLREDWETACRKAGIPFQVLSRENRTQRRDYRNYYNTDSIGLVAKHWAKEIELFTYQFEINH